MSKQTFVANTILTAAQMNTLQANDYNQTVSTKTASYTLVASDAGTRVVMNVASANTVTVNTSLFSAGDTLVIQNIGAGVTTVTAGTATVSSAGPLTIPQNGSGTLYFTSAGVSIFYPSAGPAATSGLTFVGGGTLSGASTTISNCFSATYDNYEIIVSGPQAAAGNPALLMTIGAITSGYVRGLITNNGAWVYSSSNSSWELGFAGDASDSNVMAQVFLTNPFLVAKKVLLGASVFPINTVYEVYGEQETTTSCTSLTLTLASSTLAAGNVRVYGYQNS